MILSMATFNDKECNSGKNKSLSPVPQHTGQSDAPGWLPTYINDTAGLMLRGGCMSLLQGGYISVLQGGLTSELNRLLHNSAHSSVATDP